MEQQPTTPAPVQNQNDLRAALAKKILTVQSELGTLYKDGVNSKQNYAFVSYELMNARLRDVLPRIGLVIIPAITRVQERDVQGRSGIVTRTLIEGTLTLVDCDTGFAMSLQIAGADNDTAGKSLGKAFTEMVKRAEMKLFHVTTIEEHDPDAEGLGLYGGANWNGPVGQDGRDGQRGNQNGGARGQEAAQPTWNPGPGYQQNFPPQQQGYGQ
jgi:hypothetical protein